MKPNDQYEHKGTHKIATIIEVIRVLKSENLFSGKGNIKLKKRAIQGYRIAYHYGDNKRLEETKSSFETTHRAII